MIAPRNNNVALNSTNMENQQGLSLQFRSMAVAERSNNDSPLYDLSNRQYLTPRWRERAASPGSMDVPLPSLDNENSPLQPRYLDFTESLFLTPANRRGPVSRNTTSSPLPYLPFDVEEDSANSSSVPVRLAPRYDRRGDSFF